MCWRAIRVQERARLGGARKLSRSTSSCVALVLVYTHKLGERLKESLCGLVIRSFSGWSASFSIRSCYGCCCWLSVRLRHPCAPGDSVCCLPCVNVSCWACFLCVAKYSICSCIFLFFLPVFLPCLSCVATSLSLRFRGDRDDESCWLL